MNLTLFFRLIIMSIFQKQVTHNHFYKSIREVEKMNYDNTLFHCPCVYAKDGFYVSLQIHNSNYANSENGYRKLGHTWEDVEFGFPSENEPLMHQYSEMYGEEIEDFSVIDTVGRIPIKILEQVFEKHGGIDWEKTISIEQYDRLVHGKYN